MEKNKSDLPIKLEDGRWLYDKIRLSELFQKMSDKRKILILQKAINIMEKRGVPKWSAVAMALDCIYDDFGFWYRKKEIRH